jgi:hypothetical protein
MSFEGLIIVQYLADFVQLIAECKLRIKRHSIYRMSVGVRGKGRKESRR